MAWSVTDVLGWHHYGLGGGFGWTDLIKDYKGAAYGYQYTPNTALIKWVFNQTIVPWLVTVMFLINKENVSVYAFLGLLMLPYAPLPFIGIFIIMLLMGICMMKKTPFSKLIAMGLSPCNLLGAFAITPVFYLFYRCNVASNKIGLYVPPELFTYKRIFVLIAFCFIEFGIFAILIGREYKKDPLFWIMVFSLCIIPNLKIGPGHDFCMRASIPALFILMVLTTNYLFTHLKNINTTCILLIMCLTVCGLGTWGDYCVDLRTMRAEGRIAVIADDVKTFSHRPVYNDPEVFYTVNYLCPAPYDTLFYKYLAK